MQTRKSHRVKRVKSALEALPLREDALKEAFDDFRMFGELPEHERLAQAVVESAIVGELRPALEENDLMREFHLLVEERKATGGKPKERTLREYLLDHAGYAPPALREPARLALRRLVAQGRDITDPMFLADAPLPGHNGIGMHALGYPQKLATPPYEEQAKRLFARYADLRQRVPEGDAGWFGEMADAVLTFQATAELPDDDLMRDVVLADTELHCLFQHAAGYDVSAMMAILDRAATAQGTDRAVAIREVQAIARARPA